MPSSIIIKRSPILKSGAGNAAYSLITTDNLRKEKLQKELKDLEDNEAGRIALEKLQIESLRNTAIRFPVTGFFIDNLFYYLQ